MKRLFATRNRDAADIARTLLRLAVTDLPLLLEGETGVGKNFVAARCHRASRPGRPLVLVDCGAVPVTLLASALFGHRTGAFTDATRSHVGLLERARDGTVLLDRVDALPPEGQAALLRVLEERTFFPVGTSTPRPFRARVISIAGSRLAERVRSEEFRPDLYHRLAGYHAILPPLRKRREDILPFARAFLRRHARASRRAVGLSGEAETVLTAYPWPGNFRELETALTRALVRTQGDTVEAADLGLPPDAWPEVAELAARRGAPLAEVERLYALWVLASENGNVSRAARTLGVARRTLIRWRKQG